MTDEDKAEIYRRSDELLRQLIRDEPKVRELLDNVRGEQSSTPRGQLAPVTEWMRGEA